jgi:hypothetical protein
MQNSQRKERNLIFLLFMNVTQSKNLFIHASWYERVKGIENNAMFT